MYVSAMYSRITPGGRIRAASEVHCASRPGSSRRCTELRSGFASSDPFLRGSPEQRGFDQVDGFIYRIESSPSWAVPVRVRRRPQRAGRRAGRGLVLAVYCEPRLRDAVVRWLRRGPRPPLARVSQSVLQGAFLRGEAKGLWLHGTHLRSVLRPDTEHITGRQSRMRSAPWKTARLRCPLPGRGFRTTRHGRAADE